jgi:hypothetical protein
LSIPDNQNDERKNQKVKNQWKKKVKQIPANPGDEIENKYQDYGSNDEIKKKLKFNKKNKNSN